MLLKTSNKFLTLRVEPEYHIYSKIPYVGG